MDLVSELIGRRGLWAAQARSMKEFAATITSCRNRLTASVDRLRDLGPAGAAPALSTGKDPAADVAGEARRLAELAEDLAVVAEAARTSAIPLADDADALSRLSLQLWEALQAIRVVPAGCLFQRLARVARDAARIEGRDVEVVTLGDETGIDRTVQDKAFEPLLHVVRNAVGHGIEPAEERIERGKPASGRVTLRARREGNTLVLSVQDDGRGLDYAAIAAKGRRLGLVGAGEEPGIDRLNALVFQAGFSTRPEANAISGRGVGMDVVAQEVGLLRGTIALASEPVSAPR
jgi:chemotaxis protein histidine kinase CheA